MKTTTKLFQASVLAIVTALFVFAGTTSSFADPYHHNHHEAWSHDNHGYWDSHSSYHSYTYYNHHHGYWRENNGVRLFINVD